MYEDFKKYLIQHKKNFNVNRFNTDQMYRAVCFGQFGVPYKSNRKDKPNDYYELEYEVKQYQKRIANQ